MMVGSSSADIVGRAFVYLGKEECVADHNLWVIKHSQNPRYLLHALSSPYVRKQIYELSQQKDIYWGIRKLNSTNIKNLFIPLPDLDAQEKIANYLDELLLNEIELSDSLEKMVEVRKKQYEYYKEQILTGGMDRWDG